ncbi:MAG: DUF1318 domain-containing protein [Desulfobacterales bacterium]|nr:DUF1318 domain-containing protein [Desulfobacterales bacterium]MDD3082098.1 DUF1318 domain-containing protein [Desulfobacterales bacterium]MDD3950577.1 DUF1318 domain-containing protein [Desulfobacterales bacterium]
MKGKRILAAICFVSLVFSLAATAAAQDRNTVVNSMKERYPALLQAKAQGFIGETWNGLVSIVNPAAPAGAKAIADGESSDRRALFQIIAKETSTPVEEVARQNRIRMYRLAEDNHFLQNQNRQWVLKKDLK